MSVESIIYRGKRILRLDYRGQDEAAMIRQMEKALEWASGEKEVLLLSVYADQLLGRGFRQRAKDLGRQLTEHGSLRNAAVGLDGPQKIFVNTFGYFTRSSNAAFETEDEAKEWLIGQ